MNVLRLAAFWGFNISTYIADSCTYQKQQIQQISIKENGQELKIKDP